MQAERLADWRRTPVLRFRLRFAIASLSLEATYTERSLTASENGPDRARPTAHPEPPSSLMQPSFPGGSLIAPLFASRFNLATASLMSDAT